MHRFLPLVAVALVSMFARLPSAAESATEVPADAAALVGTWRAVSIEADGSISNPDDAAKITVINAADGGWTVLADGKLVARGTNDLQPWSVPKAIDFTVVEDAEGPVTERRHLGIYELQRNTRRLCFAPPGAERPASFSAPRGSGLVLVTFERIAD
jgi:uncharacterized protein (TIGR03067 family)